MGEQVREWPLLFLPPGPFTAVLKTGGTLSPASMTRAEFQSRVGRGGENGGADGSPEWLPGSERSCLPSSRAVHLCQNSSRSHESHSEISDGSMSSRVSR